MRRFELVDGKSSKFWSIERRGSTLSLAWGRIGTQGQSKDKDFGTEAKAEKEYESLIREKTSKGYVELGEVAAPAPSPAATADGPKPPPDKPEVTSTSADESEFHFSDVVLPRRGGRFRAPALSVNAKAALRKTAKLLVAREVGGKPAKVVSAIVARMEQVASTGELLPPAEIEVEGALIALFPWGWPMPKPSVDPIDYLVGVGGPALAVRALVESLRFSAKGDAKSVQLEPTPSELILRFQQLAHLRHHLAVADDAAYAAALEQAKALHEPSEYMRVCALAFLFPEQSAWANAATDAVLQGKGGYSYGLALAWATDPVDLTKLAKFNGYQLLGGQFDFLPTFVDGVGERAVEFLKQLMQGGIADWQRIIGAALSSIPSDVAIDLLVENAGDRTMVPSLVSVIERWPRRSLRCLARGASSRGGPAHELLTGLVRSRAAELRDEIAALPDAQRSWVLELSRESDAPEALADELPPVLASVPWLDPKRSKAPAPLRLETLPHVSRVVYAPGERERAARRSGEPYARCPSLVIAYGNEELAKKTLAAWDPALHDYYQVEAAPVILARFGDEAVPKLEAMVEKSPSKTLPTVMPIESCRLALVAAKLLANKSVRKHAQAYLRRHPGAAAIALIPEALGSGKGRDVAATALALVAESDPAIVREVADRYGSDASAAVEALLGRDPLDDVPKRLPTLPDSFKPAALPPLMLKNGKRVPLSSVEHIGTMLAFSQLDRPYAGVQQLREACDQASLGKFAWSLFNAWLLAGADSKQDWALTALAQIGDDECVRKLTPLLRKWPGEAAHARAVRGLEVLAALGTDVALMALNGIAQKLKFKGLQDKAREKIEEIAEARGLTRAELEDRLAPDLGLDDDGSLTLDFGSRQFRVGFDEALRPFVMDSARKHLTNLPKPGKSDDAELAAAATARWKALKADVRTLSAQQVLRLELAMCQSRRWTPELFEQLLVRHPLMIHLVRRVVWGAFRDSEPLFTFRVAEDRSFASSKDEAVTLPADAAIGLMHMLELDPSDAAAWGDVFSDYELLQPFEQLGRAVYRPTAEEQNDKLLKRVDKVRVPTGNVLKLESRGWRRGQPQDSGCIWWFDKPLNNDGLVARLSIDPGIIAGDAMWEPEQTLGTVVITDDASWDVQGDRPFGDLPDVSFSELVRDLEQLRA